MINNNKIIFNEFISLISNKINGYHYDDIILNDGTESYVLDIGYKTYCGNIKYKRMYVIFNIDKNILTNHSKLKYLYDKDNLFFKNIVIEITVDDIRNKLIFDLILDKLVILRDYHKSMKLNFIKNIQDSGGFNLNKAIDLFSKRLDIINIDDGVKLIKKLNISELNSLNKYLNIYLNYKKFNTVDDIINEFIEMVTLYNKINSFENNSEIDLSKFDDFELKLHYKYSEPPAECSIN